MPRRHSAMFVRSNTNNFFEGRAYSVPLPSVGKACSKSLPNLTCREKTKRVFVTFEKDSPRAQVVDLKGKSDVADKCRLLNKKLTSDDAAAEKILQEKIHKKAMIKKWVIATAQFDWALEYDKYELRIFFFALIWGESIGSSFRLIEFHYDSHNSLFK